MICHVGRLEGAKFHFLYSVDIFMLLCRFDTIIAPATHMQQFTTRTSRLYNTTLHTPRRNYSAILGHLLLLYASRGGGAYNLL